MEKYNVDKKTYSYVDLIRKIYTYNSKTGINWFNCDNRTFPQYIPDKKKKKT